MTDISNYHFHKVLYEARVAERQRELRGAHLVRRNRKRRWSSVRFATARALHKLAHAIEPAHALRVPAQRKPA